MAEKIVCEEFEEFYRFIEQLEVRGRMRKESRNELQQIVEQFRQKCLQWKVPEVAEKNPELKEMFNGFLNGIKESVESWNSRFQNRAKQEAFEEKFRDKFIVFIYGKVKAGKSTLENFIVNNRLPNQDVEFCVYDSNSKEQRQNITEFATNITECTSEIQLFTLGGLVWVDTPGLGSITKENGALAKRYIELADFVLYPTNSASAMQNNEIAEISQLLLERKPVHILITRSDAMELDEEDGKIVRKLMNKTEKTRKKQAEDALERLKEHLSLEQQKLIPCEILSISVEAAKQGLEKNDLELFRNSNLPKFYKQFNAILQEKVQNLKNQSPFDSLIGLINSILGDIQSKIYNGTLAGMRLEYEKLQSKLETQRKNLEDSIHDLRGIIPQMIAEEFEIRTIDKDNYKQQCGEIRDTISNKLQAKIIEICKKSMEDFATDFCKSMESINVNDVQDTTITREVEKKSTFGKTIVKGIAAFLGGLGGAFFTFANPIGAAAAGAAVAATTGLITDKIESFFTDKGTEQLTLDGNLEETLRHFREKLQDSATNNLGSPINQMDNIFFKPLKEQLGIIERDISIFHGELEALKKKYGQ